MTRVVWWMRSIDPQNSGFTCGFNVFQQILRQNEPPSKQRQGILPSCPRIPDLHNLWQERYNRLNDRSRIIWNNPMPTNIAQTDIDACRRLTRDLEDEMQRWLNTTDSGWLQITHELRAELGQTFNLEVCILIQSDETLIWQLPWLFWNLLSHSPTKTRITFSHL